MPRIAQISDLHLSADRGARYRGIDPWASFDAVLQGAVGDADLVVLTGDIAQDERLETYQQLREHLGPIADRCRVIPGNHDDPAALRATFPAPTPLVDGTTTFVDRVGGMQVVGLDTHVPGEVYGALDDAQLEALGEVVQRGPTIVFLHHQPGDVDSAWIDRWGLQAPDRLAASLRDGQVAMICHGHAHQEISREWVGIRVVGTPSTNAQFEPGSGEPRLHDGAFPGWRSIDITAEGCATEVHRVRRPEFRTAGGLMTR